MAERNDYGYPTLELYQEPVTEADLLEAERAERMESVMFLMDTVNMEDEDLAEMYNYN